MDHAFRLIRKGAVLASASLLAWLALAGVSSAEMLFLTTGRTMTVRSHRLEGDRLVLTLVGGGEVTCDPALVDRIAPDEVPIRDPERRRLRATRRTRRPPTPEMIERSAAREGVDPRLVRAVIQVESAYQPDGPFPQGRGRPDAADAGHGAAIRAWPNPYDPGSNIEAGIKHLKMLLDRFEQLPLALAAYNAGEAAVERFGGIPPYPGDAELRPAGPAAARAVAGQRIHAPSAGSPGRPTCPIRPPRPGAKVGIIGGDRRMTISDLTTGCDGIPL